MYTNINALICPIDVLFSIFRKTSSQSSCKVVFKHYISVKIKSVQTNTDFHIKPYFYYSIERLISCLNTITLDIMHINQTWVLHYLSITITYNDTSNCNFFNNTIGEASGCVIHFGALPISQKSFAAFWIVKHYIWNITCDFFYI